MSPIASRDVRAGESRDSNRSEIYDPATNLFTFGAALSTGPGGTATSTLLADGRVLVAGGRLATAA